MAFVRRNLGASKFYRLFIFWIALAGQINGIWSDAGNPQLMYRGAEGHRSSKTTGRRGREIASKEIYIAKFAERADVQSFEAWRRTGENRRPDQPWRYFQELRVRDETLLGVPRFTRTLTESRDGVNDKRTSFRRSYDHFSPPRNISPGPSISATRRV